MPASCTRRKIISLRVIKVVLFAAPLLLLLLLLSAVLPRLRDRGFRAFFDDPRVIRDEQFTIYVEAGDPCGDGVERILKQFLNHLYAEWGGDDRLDLCAPRELEFPVVVLLFKNHDRLKQYHGPRYRDESIEYNAGMYEPVAGTIALISRRLPGFRELRRGLYHETTHMVLDKLVRGTHHDWSLWLNEGLATYLEASVEVEGVGFQLGRATHEHLLRVAALGPVAIQPILRLGPDDFRGERNDRAYALASVFVAFLLEGDGGRYQRRFWRYVAAERAAGPVARGTFRRVFGRDPDRLAPAFQRFVTDHLDHW